MLRGKSSAGDAHQRPAPIIRIVLPWLVAMLAAMAALGGWALASPPGSSPDDDYHQASIWCAGGLDPDRCGDAGDGARAIPRLASGAAICYANDNTISGACQDGMQGTALDVGTPHGNWKGAYPPYFYSFMSTFVGPDVERSVLLMRLANSGLIVLLVGALAALLPRRRRPLATLPLLATAVPLSMSILASTNPSSWAIVGAATVWPALYVAFEVQGRRQWALSLYAVAVAFVGSGSRADGCLFVLMSVALVLLLRIRHLRSALVPTAAGLMGMAVAAGIFLSSGHASAVTDGFGYTRPELTDPQLFYVNITSLPTLWFGSFGSGPLGRTGWLDTVYAPLVPALITAVWMGLVLFALRRPFPAKVVGLALAGSALVVYPMYLLMRSHVMVGEGVQPRYLLPMLVFFTGLTMLGARGTVPRLSRGAYGAIVVALGLAHTIALHTQIRRYVTGLDVVKLRFGGEVEWWSWESGLGPTPVWLIGSVGFVVLTALALRPLVVSPGQPRGSARAASGAGRSPERRSQQG